MVKIAVLPKDAVEVFVGRLVEGYQVIAPVERNGQVLFGYVSDPREVVLEYRGVTLLPPKRFFFPEREILFTYEIKGGEVYVYDKYEDIRGMRRVLIGIRPCDVHGLKVLDKVFIGEFRDPYYAARREGTLIICLTCTEPGEYCFCAYTSSGPDLKDGYDLLMTDLGESYLVEVGSERGGRLVKLNLDIFREASKDDLERKEEAVRRAEAKIREQKLPNLSEMYEPLIKLFDADLWREYGRKCIACGKCNFTCPTCRCFNVYDDPNLDLKSGKRVRVWDSCHFLSFTKVASGEIFRKERHSRVKQRIYHKYCYSVDEIGSISCVGCGRCVKVCSAGIDIREVARRVMEAWGR